MAPHIKSKTKKGSSGGGRLFVVVRKKSYPLAVTRNKIKRRIRSIVLSEINMGSDDLYVYVGSGVGKLDYANLKAEVLRSMGGAHA